MSEAIAGLGTLFKRGDGTSSGAYVALAEVVSGALPGQNSDLIEVTHLNSPNFRREFIRGLRDSGEIELELNFTRDEYILIKADLDSDTPVDYQCILNDTGNTAIDFSGFVTASGGAVPLEDRVTMNVTIKITGDITIGS